VDKTGQTMALLLPEHRDEKAAQRFRTTAIRRHGVPDTITIDGSAATAAASRSDNQDHGTTVVMPQGQSLNKSSEQAHRAVQRVTRPRRGCKSCDAGSCPLGGSERMPMSRQGHQAGGMAEGLTLADPFYSLAAEFPPRQH
jgi:putative transposase